MTDSEGGGQGNPQQPPGSPAPPTPYSPPSTEQSDSAWGYQAPTAPYAGQDNPPPPYGAQQQPPPYGAQQQAPPPPYGAQQPPPPPYGQQQGAPPYGGQFGTQGAPGSQRKLPNTRVMAIGGAAVAVVVVVIVVIVLVTGGGSSPTNTANEFIQAILSNNGSKICSLYVPAEQSQCKAQEASFKDASGNGQVVSQVIQGNEALVSITGKLCLGGTSADDCESNSDPTAGMPGDSLSFDQAYAQATSPDSTALSPAAFQEINGTWYVVA